MPKWKARWAARVEQDVEVDDDVDEDEARAIVEGQMEVRNVVELLDMEIVELEPWEESPSDYPDD